MLWFRNGLRYLRILACPARGTRTSSGHGPCNRDYHGQGTNSCSENGVHTTTQCQCQPSASRNSKDLRNEHISNFIGSEVARVESAYEVDHLGQPFYDKSAAYAILAPTNRKMT